MPQPACRVRLKHSAERTRVDRRHEDLHGRAADRGRRDGERDSRGPGQPRHPFVERLKRPIAWKKA